MWCTQGEFLPTFVGHNNELIRICWSRSSWICVVCTDLHLCLCCLSDVGQANTCSFFAATYMNFFWNNRSWNVRGVQICHPPLKLLIFSKFLDMIFKLSSQSVTAPVKTLSLKSLFSPPLGFITWFHSQDHSAPINRAIHVLNLEWLQEMSSILTGHWDPTVQCPLTNMASSVCH